jgi:phospholipid/cholesterol/gamma-HCH transport system permease protein
VAIRQGNSRSPIGGRVLERLGWFGAFIAAPFAAIAALGRPRELFRQLYPIYIEALPLTFATGAALGAVVWMHLHGVLLRAGAGYSHLLPQFLALAIVLELGPLASGLVMAGRTGASLGAEIGAMQITEQVDALKAMGLSPMRYIIGPRVLACMLSLPALMVVLSAAALAASFAAEWIGGTMSWREYASACLLDLRLADLVATIIKTAVFGFLIGLTGCWSGLKASGGTLGVGRAARRGVVGSMFLVVAADVLLVRLLQIWL